MKYSELIEQAIEHLEKDDYNNAIECYIEARKLANENRRKAIDNILVSLRDNNPQKVSEGLHHLHKLNENN